MRSRIRRQLAVLLALALVPATSGAARCVEHVPLTDGAHVAAGHEHHATRSVDPVGEHVEHVVDEQPAHHSSVQHDRPAQPSVSDVHLNAPDCCPPAGVPGVCGNAMGCSVLAVLEYAQGPTVRMLADRQPDAATRALPPGPAPAPDVPPPRV